MIRGVKILNTSSIQVKKLPPYISLSDNLNGVDFVCFLIGTFGGWQRVKQKTIHQNRNLV